MTFDAAIWDNITSLLLYSAELYTLILLLLSIFIGFHATQSHIAPALPKQSDQLPSIDVFIPSYDEPATLLEATLVAATNLDYPKEKLRIYLLDDGSSEAKRESKDPAIRQKANERYQQIGQLCKTLSIHLLTRPDNQHAKAGNLNSAFAKTHGELIFVLDADHVVCSDFLQKTVGFFLAETNLGIVQTPHFFISANPVEKNLQIFDHAPSENDVFYFVSQPGLDDVNATFFCGSAGLVSRQALEDVGGFSEYSVTEDCATSLQIHAKGYDSVYVDAPLISALQPESIKSYIRQRNRWTQGMIQIFLLDNPLFKKGLTIEQRLGYLSTTLFWFFSFERLVFFIAPLLYLLFGIQIYRANLEELFAFVIPHLVVIFLATYYLYGGVRRVFMSGIYELFQSCSAIVAVIKTIVSPRSPRFQNTPKQEIYDKDDVSSACLPFYALYLLSITGLACGIWRYVAHDNAHPMIFVAFFWAACNLLYLHGVIGAFFERRQRRLFSRNRIDLPVTVILDYQNIAGQLTELSASGARVAIHASDMAADTNFPVPATLNIYDKVTEKTTALSVYIHEAMPETAYSILRMAFLQDTLAQRQINIRLNYQDSSRWQRIVDKKHQQPPLLVFASYLISHFFLSFKDHIQFLAKQLFKKRRH
jgi:cellulose synthase (UDP-forming)